MPFLNLRDYDANLTKRRMKMQKYNYLANVIKLSKKTSMMAIWVTQEIV